MTKTTDSLFSGGILINNAGKNRYAAPDSVSAVIKYIVRQNGMSKDEGSNRLHVHFATNTVNYRTRKKRHENKREVALRNQRLNQIVADEIEKYAKKY